MSMDLASVRRAYRRYASVYDSVFGWTLGHGRRLLVRMLDAKPGERLLEVGVGTGLLLPRYPRDLAVTGIDVSEEMLAVARERVRRHGLMHVTLRAMDAEHMSFASGSFDHVVIAYVYSVTPDPAKLMCEARRVCRPGGSIYVLNHFSGIGAWVWLERALRPFAASLGFRPEFPLREHVHDQHWDIVDMRTANLFGLSRIVHIRNGARP
jgi:phosphatidylethanolamine/phosphatidyl-N-methylethanolamine N-methyltransferase